MQTYRIHPIVMGTKIFDKTMMTYQHAPGTTYTIPIYCWYLEGGDQQILVDTGEWSPIQSADRERAIGGKIHTFESGLSGASLRTRSISSFTPICTTTTVKTITAVKMPFSTCMNES